MEKYTIKMNSAPFMSSSVDRLSTIYFTVQNEQGEDIGIISGDYLREQLNKQGFLIINYNKDDDNK